MASMPSKTLWHPRQSLMSSLIAVGHPHDVFSHSRFQHGILSSCEHAQAPLVWWPSSLPQFDA